MFTIGTEGNRFEIEFKHEINFIEHPRPKMNKDGSYEDPYIKAHKRIAKGGRTICFLKEVEEYDKDAFILLMEGVAECSKKDMYNRAIGREMAFGRALKKLEQYLIKEITDQLQEKFQKLKKEESVTIKRKETMIEFRLEMAEEMKKIRALRKTIAREFANRKKNHNP